uniref:Uncharacterized protein n=1 Tax=Tanacetum cinerariifolium TaxID=118510 RepID=A0A6L2JKR2_TANCI|nr:hypothetical protein [Tanacetum cinerariifolium]
MAYLRDMLLKISQVDLYAVDDHCVWTMAKDGGSSLLENLVESLTLSFVLLWCLLLLGIKRFRTKFNIFIWRLTLDGLPHRWNLLDRCIDIPLILCPSYNAVDVKPQNLLANEKEGDCEELWMKEREVNAIREIEKRLNERKMLTQEETVNEGITLDASLVSKESTNDNTTSTEQQDESSSSRYDADDEKYR